MKMHLLNEGFDYITACNSLMTYRQYGLAPPPENYKVYPGFYVVDNPFRMDVADQAPVMIFRTILSISVISRTR